MLDSVCNMSKTVCHTDSDQVLCKYDSAPHPAPVTDYSLIHAAPMDRSPLLQTRNYIYFLANVTFILTSPSILKLCKASFATVAEASSPNSTKAISFLAGIVLISTKPAYTSNTSRRSSWVVPSGRFWIKRILLGGRYSSGIWIFWRLAVGADSSVGQRGSAPVGGGIEMGEIGKDG